MTDADVELRPSQGRRVLASTILAGVGLMFWWGAATNPDQVWSARAMMAGIGGLWFWGAYELWRATARAIIMTDVALVDSLGNKIADLDQIVGLDRGVFSIKPSNGVLLKLESGGPIQWVPGLWWRVGRRVGIGGLTPKAQTKMLTGALEMHLVERIASR